MANIGIIGAGSWGTALGILLVNNGHNTTLWSHREEQARELAKTREHKEKLPGVRLPEALDITGDLEKTLVGKDILIMAVPSVAVRQTARKIKPYIRYGQLIVNVSKGIEEGTLMTLTDIIEEEIPESVPCVLSGPSHAEEVSRGLPTTCVAGARDRKTAEYIQNIFMSPVFRAYISPDVLGIELGGALKNVIALAAGAADGLGYGDNTKAALITRGITEITRLGIAHSRNRRAGILLGQGKTMEEAMKEVKMVVEGVYSAKAGWDLSQKYQVDTPIIQQVNQVLFEGKEPGLAVQDLMLRDKKIESWEVSWE